MHTEHARLLRNGARLADEVRIDPFASSSGADSALRIELEKGALVWRSQHGLDRCRPFNLFGTPGAGVRRRLDHSALRWLGSLEHRRLLLNARLRTVEQFIATFGDAARDAQALQQILKGLGARSAEPDSETPSPPRLPSELPDSPALSPSARRRRRVRGVGTLFPGLVAALRTGADHERELGRVEQACDSLLEQWIPHRTASGLALSRQRRRYPALGWRVSSRTAHGGRRALELFTDDARSILTALPKDTAVRAIAIESMRLHWAARAVGSHEAIVAFSEYERQVEALRGALGGVVETDAVSRETSA